MKLTVNPALLEENIRGSKCWGVVVLGVMLSCNRHRMAHTYSRAPAGSKEAIINEFSHKGGRSVAPAVELDDGIAVFLEEKCKEF